MKIINEMSSATDIEEAKPEMGSVLDLRGLPGQGNIILDRSACGNNGAITGATWVRLPSGLWVNSFDGTDDTTNYGTGITPGTSSFAIMLWVLKDSASTTRVIVNREETGGKNRFGMYIVDTTMAVGIALKDNDSVSFEFSNYGAITARTWYLLTAVINKSDNTVKGYINDGVPVSNSIVGMVAIIPTTDLYIGSSGASLFWAGDIALTRLWIGAIPSTVQIANIYQNERHLFGV